MIAAAAAKLCKFHTKFMEVFQDAWKNLAKFACVRQNLTMSILA